MMNHIWAVPVMINDIRTIEIGVETVMILGVNVCLILGCFIVAYRRVFVKR
ncbi:MAG: hypothetical protein NC124_18585 [Clostridium sp.]|nr:hypothetical protein [Clostridium sp.]